MWRFSVIQVILILEHLVGSNWTIEGLKNWRRLSDERWNVLKQDKKSSCFLLNTRKVQIDLCVLKWCSLLCAQVTNMVFYFDRRNWNTTKCRYVTSVSHLSISFLPEQNPYSRWKDSLDEWRISQQHINTIGDTNKHLKRVRWKKNVHVSNLCKPTL